MKIGSKYNRTYGANSSYIMFRRNGIDSGWLTGSSIPIGTLIDVRQATQINFLSYVGSPSAGSSVTTNYFSNI